MRGLGATILSGLLLLGGHAAFAQSPGDQVTTAYAAWNEAFNKADAAAIGAMYTADAKLLPPTHEVMDGQAGVEKFFAGLFAAGVTGHSLELIEATGDADTIAAAARWAAKGKDTGGAAMDVGGIAMHVFEKQADGSLKLKMHTFN